MYSNRVEDDTATKEVAFPVPGKAMKRPRFRKYFSLWLSIAGMASLAFMLGAAVIHFDLPSSGFLRDAFQGADAWNERRQVTSRTSDEELTPAVGKIDSPEKTFDGFTLYTVASM